MTNARATPKRLESALQQAAVATVNARQRSQEVCDRLDHDLARLAVGRALLLLKEAEHQLACARDLLRESDTP